MNLLLQFSELYIIYLNSGPLKSYKTFIALHILLDCHLTEPSSWFIANVAFLHDINRLDHLLPEKVCENGTNSATRKLNKSVHLPDVHFH